jgi:MYXO-CTERM domain-containing protein
MICANVAGEGNVCVFSNAGLADAGDSCGPPGCVDECVGNNIATGCNVCLPIDDAGNSQCFAGCTPQNGNQGCRANESCIGFQCRNSADCGGGACSNGQCQNAGVCLSGGGAALRGQACSNEVGCVSGLACIVDASGDNGVCLGLCGANGSGCLQNENCLFLFTDEDQQGACLPTGPGGEGDRCTDYEGCARGLICLGGFCNQRCDRGFACAEASQSCAPLTGGNGMEVCVPLGNGGGGGGGEGEGEGEPSPGGCDARRGNFDCPQGQSCTESGRCVPGEGPVGTFGLCDASTDCSGGLCINGVCTRPCDLAGGCPDGYSCDASSVPGGVCRAESCRDSEEVCAAADGFTCTYTSASRYACAKGVAASGCACTASSTNEAGLAFGLVLFGLWSRRRRR